MWRGLCFWCPLSLGELLFRLTEASASSASGKFKLKLQAESAFFYDSGRKFVIISGGPRPGSFPSKESWHPAGGHFLLPTARSVHSAAPSKNVAFSKLDMLFSEFPKTNHWRMRFRVSGLVNHLGLVHPERARDHPSPSHLHPVPPPPPGCSWDVSFCNKLVSSKYCFPEFLKTF